MKEQIQSNYENRLRSYVALIHGNEPPGLVAKLAIYSSLLAQQHKRGGRFLRIEPLLYPLSQAVEVDLHLATAKLLEPNGNRSERSLFAFLDFCEKNRTNITWKSGAIPADVIQKQSADLEAHRATIQTILARRDKFFAHLDKQYFNDPTAIYRDYPLDGQAVIALVNCIIAIISGHHMALEDKANFHIAEFYEIAVDNMLRNLEEGRTRNFPGQLEQQVPTSQSLEP
ncbi:AbiU2 domain-containing protein [Rhizobium bangladeshense]|uniref:AbiU2 domain-containing protein n=1 Tax=Rhizobium bangladeshense TaxID=1138189 RepID=UPI001C8298C8|nr:hypothetical protein [Rhizobium bangladeshense]MBX4898846.1 hypothetical protein [Rhizobium bangladeshense]MBY3616942.1 hypothetical protein [Rhizobium bangladeshense]